MDRPTPAPANVVYVDFVALGSFPEDPAAWNKQTSLERSMRDSMVQATVDATTPGVDVPAPHQLNPDLRLNLSHRFGLPFRTDLHAIWATLTFGGKNHDCVVPWAALRAIVSQRTGEVITFDPLLAQAPPPLIRF